MSLMLNGFLLEYCIKWRVSVDNRNKKMYVIVPLGMHHLVSGINFLVLSVNLIPVPL